MESESKLPKLDKKFVRLVFQHVTSQKRQLIEKEKISACEKEILNTKKEFWPILEGIDTYKFTYALRSKHMTLFIIIKKISIQEKKRSRSTLKKPFT